MKKRKTTQQRHTLKVPDWTPFENAQFPGHEQLAEATKNGEKHFRGVFINSRYQVSLYDYNSPWGELTWLAIVNLDRGARHDWRDMQRIKNELCGPEREAFEIFPAETRLIDTNNQFHMFVLPEGKALPVGFAVRDVGDQHRGNSLHKQRPFEQVPEDLNANPNDEMGWPVFAAGEEEMEDPYGPEHDA